MRSQVTEDGPIIQVGPTTTRILIHRAYAALRFPLPDLEQRVPPPMEVDGGHRGLKPYQ